MARVRLGTGSAPVAGCFDSGEFDSSWKERRFLWLRCNAATLGARLAAVRWLPAWRDSRMTAFNLWWGTVATGINGIVA